MPNIELTANIHHFFAQGNRVKLDDEGEPMIGFYFEIMQGSRALSELTGPYNSGPEAEAACRLALKRGDY